MMVATAQISESLQMLIDSRLDTIDRMLLGRLSRQDRMAIVREVESQIHELIQASEGDELTREDVLAVLARLDPPEAYLPNETDGGPVTVRGLLRHEQSNLCSRPTSGSAVPAAFWAWQQSRRYYSCCHSIT